MLTHFLNNQTSTDPEAIYAKVMRKIVETHKISFQLLGLFVYLGFVALLTAPVLLTEWITRKNKKEDTSGSKV